MSRNPAAKGKADSNQSAIAQAIAAIGCPVMDLSAAGNGVEDLLVGLQRGGHRWWLLVECKVPKGKGGTVQPSQYKPRQIEWRAFSAGWPRVTVTSGQNAVDQIREMTT